MTWRRERAALLIVLTAAAMPAWCGVRRAQEKEQERKNSYLSEYGPGGLDGYSFHSQTIGKGLKFVIRRHGKRRADIVMIEGRSRTTMPDERIVEPNNDTSEGTPNETIIEPGQTFKGYDFYPSPDRKWLFVERPCFRRFAVCGLYRRVSPTRMVPVHPGALRLDDAAVSALASYRKWSFRKLRGGARNAGFQAWDVPHRRLSFWVLAASDWYPEDSHAQAHGVIRATASFSYDLKTGAVKMDNFDKDYADYNE